MTDLDRAEHAPDDADHGAIDQASAVRGLALGVLISIPLWLVILSVVTRCSR